jgi:CheY-like chemotaxis protein
MHKNKTVPPEQVFQYKVGHHTLQGFFLRALPYKLDLGAYMRIRKLLLVHPGRSIRALIKKYIFAELSDIEIGEADGGQHALEQLGAKGYDVIISSEQLKDMGLEQFKNHQEATAPNGHTPLIILSESESDDDRDGLVQQGFDHVVQIRVSPADLIKKINTVCDPRNWRKDTRYHIPNAFVVITTCPSQKTLVSEIIGKYTSVCQPITMMKTLRNLVSLMAERNGNGVTLELWFEPGAGSML